MKRFLCRNCDRIFTEKELVRVLHACYSAGETERILKFRNSIQPEVIAVDVNPIGSRRNPERRKEP